VDYQALIREQAHHPLPPDLGKQLRPLLSSDSPLLAVLGLVMARAQEMAWAIQAENLATDEGRAAAIKSQGLIGGLQMAVDVILAPVRELEDA
jgi:hypothetical protein